MIPELGHFALILAFVVAIVQGTLPLIGASRGDVRLMALGRTAALTQAFLVALSFGALAVNDIVAAALSVTFVELSTRAFYTAWPNPCVTRVCGCSRGCHFAESALRASRPFTLWLLHCFKARLRSHGCICPPAADAPRAALQLGFVYALISDSFKLGG